MTVRSNHVVVLSTGFVSASTRFVHANTNTKDIQFIFLSKLNQYCICILKKVNSRLETAFIFFIWFWIFQMYV